MNKTQSISILKARFGADYLGAYKIAHTGNLIEDIMNEGDEGKIFHRFATLPMPTIVSDENLQTLAAGYV